MSSALFNLYIVDRRKNGKKRNKRHSDKERKTMHISIRDDMLVLAKNKVALKDMIGTLKSFLKERKLELCIEKTKISI